MVNSKHDNTVNNLVDRLEDSNNYEIVGKFKEYGYKNGSLTGEIDAYAIKLVNDNFYLLLFEIKSSDNIRNFAKAVGQLDREENYFKSAFHKIMKFYACPNKNSKNEVYVHRVW